MKKKKHSLRVKEFQKNSHNLFLVQLKSLKMSERLKRGESFLRSIHTMRFKFFAKKREAKRKSKMCVRDRSCKWSLYTLHRGY